MTTESQRRERPSNRSARSQERSRPPLNAPPHFTEKINRLEQKLREFRRISRQPDMKVEYLLKQFHTYAVWYQELLEIAQRDNITWNYYKYQHRNIHTYMCHIEENIQAKQWHQQVQKSSGVPWLFKALATLAAVTDNVLRIVNLPALATPIADLMLRVWGMLKGEQYTLLENPAAPRGYLPPGR